MNIFRENEAIKNHQFLFDSEIIDPVILLERELRNENLYDSVDNPEFKSLYYLKQIQKSFNGNFFLIAASDDVAKQRKLRSKKGVLWNYKNLKEHNYLNFEIEISNSNTRLISIVDLTKFTFDSSEELILNWLSCFMVLTKLNIETIFSNAKNWAEYESDSIFSYNFNAVNKDLINNDEMAILRYFPAENGRNERLIVVGNENFINVNVKSCIAEIEI